jgi:hypothetical protein
MKEFVRNARNEAVSPISYWSAEVYLEDRSTTMSKWWAVSLDPSDS